MKKILVICAMLIAVVLCSNKSFAQSTSVTETAKQVGFYIAHNDGIKAGLMLANTDESAILFGHIDAIQNRLSDKGRFYDVEIVSNTSFSDSEVSVIVKYLCEEGGLTVDYHFLLVDNQWKLSTANLKK